MSFLTSLAALIIFTMPIPTSGFPPPLPDGSRILAHFRQPFQYLIQSMFLCMRRDLLQLAGPGSSFGVHASQVQPTAASAQERAPA